MPFRSQKEVDNDGNVSLRGNSSVEVWINGKASGLTTDTRAQILQQLPAESIDRIEVIDNPSAKFSAEGSVGIINIGLRSEYMKLDAADKVVRLLTALIIGSLLLALQSPEYVEYFRYLA